MTATYAEREGSFWNYAFSNSLYRSRLASRHSRVSALIQSLIILQENRP